MELGDPLLYYYSTRYMALRIYTSGFCIVVSKTPHAGR
jgi:hypothetical protein